MRTRVGIALMAGILGALAGGGESALPDGGVAAPGAQLRPVEGQYRFAEGPTADAAGNVYFSDVAAGRTYRWSVDGKVTLFRENTGNANGLYLDAAGSLICCEGANGRLTAVDPQGRLTIVADSFEGRRFNQPNDVWIDPRGGIYFTDPIYGPGEDVQHGQHVYYVAPDRKSVVRVVSDLVRPNGLVGTPDGKTLYVSDHGAGKVYRYQVGADGTLANKTLFAPVGADGMTLDARGNLYLCERSIRVFDPAGRQVDEIRTPERPTNVEFCGPERKTLFITTQTAVYTLAMAVPGAAATAPAAAARSARGLPDTGQTGDYTPTPGENSDYARNPLSYTDNGDGTVTDNVTGLMWQKADGGEMTWEAAAGYARGLALGGHHDWRLPTSGELFSILDHVTSKPPLDTRFFTGSAAEYWWSSTVGAGRPGCVWVVNAGGGIGAHPTAETVSAGGEKRIDVRCVRGTTPPALLAGADRLAANGDGSVTDRETGLVWQQAEAGAPMTWEDALKYCEGLTLAGRDDWRLPNIKELRSLSDDRLVGPSVDRRAFPGASPASYWSSTTECSHPSQAWVVDFREGLVTHEEKTGTHHVRAVRCDETRPGTPVPVTEQTRPGGRGGGRPGGRPGGPPRPDAGQGPDEGGGR